MRIAAERGRAARPGIELGVCGEHGGDPASIRFFHAAGLDYVSCSPFRVPIARGRGVPCHGRSMQNIKDTQHQSSSTHKRVAVTGVSRSSKDHGANVVYQRLRSRGYEVFAVNPNADEVEGDRCFHDSGARFPEGSRRS